MRLDNYKPAWAMFKAAHSANQLSREEILALIATPKNSKQRSVMVHVMMMVLILLACY